MAVQPAACSWSRAASIVASVRPWVASRNAWTVRSAWPAASSSRPTRVRLRARRSSGRAPMPTTPHARDVALQDPVAGVVAGRHDRLRAEGQRPRADGDGLREGAADVDPDAQRPHPAT
jgi:hypothetical protein